MKIKTVKVKAGDTLWALAEEHLGSGQRWKDIFLMNAARFVYAHSAAPAYVGPNFIYPGDELDIVTDVQFDPSAN